MNFQSISEMKGESRFEVSQRSKTHQVSEGAVTQGNSFCNLQRNGVTGQVADEIARVTPPLRNTSRNEKFRRELQEK